MTQGHPEEERRGAAEARAVAISQSPRQGNAPSRPFPQGHECGFRNRLNLSRRSGWATGPQDHARGPSTFGGTFVS
ncbi:hypothetical protein GCM10010844_39080 [Deinococcus radiotolerans]|uniref:Uncharacterized protein n=1 Tax=Deinococcus radiotolerans TaxID=1309407 RepID=A0ABQ2FQD9_9DEIO|nr:hypothetical protein GCM10010844_39080 [Deinococcus radiotolerans]